eukprot:Mrub_15240.p1 GENE.Mrub_15240~~Mrub_15240.p1  ORF type:complete len:106 (-),score=2.55 Mrub_15240:8-325(-)
MISIKFVTPMAASYCRVSSIAADISGDVVGDSIGSCSHAWCSDVCPCARWSISAGCRLMSSRVIGGCRSLSILPYYFNDLEFHIYFIFVILLDYYMKFIMKIIEI